jgi:hypothetical protein
MDALGALATVTRTVDMPNGRTLQLEHPRSLADGIVERTLIPAVLTCVRSVHSVAAAVQYAVVTTHRENELRIIYHGARARVLRDDIIPVMAAAEAHQWGRDRVRGRMFDSDLETAALAEMQARLDRRWTY